jgi:hypothetical protein
MFRSTYHPYLHRLRNLFAGQDQGDNGDGIAFVQTLCLRRPRIGGLSVFIRLYPRSSRFENS